MSSDCHPRGQGLTPKRDFYFLYLSSHLVLSTAYVAEGVIQFFSNLFYTKHFQRYHVRALYTVLQY